MSILIKGAKPPGGCAFCYFNVDSKCALIPGCNYDETNGWQRRDDCPLIELPDHGDLKDVDAIIGNMQSLFDEREEEARYTGNRNVTVSWNDAVYLVKSAPVIIPAESEIDKWWERSETVNAERSE